VLEIPDELLDKVATPQSWVIEHDVEVEFELLTALFDACAVLIRSLPEAPKVRLGEVRELDLLTLAAYLQLLQRRIEVFEFVVAEAIAVG